MKIFKTKCTYSLLYISVVVILSTRVVSTQGLQCRECFYATDVKLCRFNSTCAPNELCGVHKIQYDGDTEYHLGCTSKERCSGTENLSPIIGRRKKRTASTVWLHCCNTDMCNVDPEHLRTGLPNMIKPTPSSIIYSQYGSTYDLKTELPTLALHTTSYESMSSATISHVANKCTDHSDCSFLMQHVDICKDEESAQTLCPNACGVCNSLNCQDHKSCSYLLSHFKICSNPDSAKNICPKSCGYCGRVCKDKDSDCHYLDKTIHICRDPDAIKTVGCEATCGVCYSVANAGYQRYTTITDSGFQTLRHTQRPTKIYSAPVTELQSSMTSYKVHQSQYTDRSVRMSSVSHTSNTYLYSRSHHLYSTSYFPEIQFTTMTSNDFDIQ